MSIKINFGDPDAVVHHGWDGWLKQANAFLNRVSPEGTRLVPVVLPVDQGIRLETIRRMVKRHEGHFTLAHSTGTGWRRHSASIHIWGPQPRIEVVSETEDVTCVTREYDIKPGAWCIILHTRWSRDQQVNNTMYFSPPQHYAGVIARIAAFDQSKDAERLQEIFREVQAQASDA